MGRKKKEETGSTVEVAIDEFVQEREDLSLEFAKIALAAQLAHPGADAWPEVAIAKRVRGVGLALATEFYPKPAMATPLEASHLQGAQSAQGGQVTK